MTTGFGKLIRLPLRLIPRTAKFPILSGPLRGKKWIVGSGVHGCWLGSYERDKQVLFKQVISSGQVVYDIGANVGFYTLLAAQLAGPTGRVISLEPLAENLSYLRAHVELNRLANVTVVDSAVSDRSGKTFFSEGENRSMGHLDSGGTLHVQTVTVDDLVFKNAFPPPNALKIDVEGAESLVLSGATRVLATYHPAVFLSIVAGTEDHRQACKLLESLHYTITPIDGPTKESSDELLARVLSSS